MVYQLHRARKKSLSAQAIELIKEEKHEIATAIFAQSNLVLSICRDMLQMDDGTPRLMAPCTSVVRDQLCSEAKLRLFD